MSSNCLTVFCLTLILTFVHAGRRCLLGTRLTQPLDSSTVTECGAHEVCFMDKYITNDGITFFDIGCKDPLLCNPSGRKRRDKKRGVTVVCSQCCDTKDICNLDGYCGAEDFKPPQGSKLCYECSLAKHPDDCNQITLCDRDSACSIKQTTNLIGDSRWKHECSQKTQCAVVIASNPQGICSYCCQDQLCNRNCTLPPTTLAPPTTTPLPTTTTTTPVPLSAPVILRLDIQPPSPLQYGSNVVVRCIATGNPPPVYEFLYRGSGLASNVHVSQTSNELTITSYRQDNDGMYRCVATNSLGDDHKDFQLTGQ